MTLPVLEFELRSLIDRAKSGRGNVRREGLQVEIGGVTQRLSLEVIPVGGTESPGSTFIIAFEAMPAAAPETAPEDPDDDAKIADSPIGKRVGRNKGTYSVGDR